MNRPARRRSSRLPAEPVTATIEALNSDGSGVCRVDGKAVFVHGGLPGETVEFVYSQRRRQHDVGRLERLQTTAADRVEPGCAHFSICGGCAMQHLSSAAQIQHKQTQLLETLARIGKVTPDSVYPPLSGDSCWGYRRKARLGVRYVRRKERVLVGFRERGSNYLADIDHCRVLHPRVGGLLVPLADLIGELSLRERIPQIEVAMDDDSLVLVFRVMAAPDTEDRRRLAAFAQRHDLVVYLQPGGPETVKPLAEPADLGYRLPAFGLRLGFAPTDFTQVNLDVNRRLIERALGLLAPGDGDHVLDLFCGIGNFSLPIASRANRVLGVEGDSTLVARARGNARDNAVGNAEFEVGDLFDETLLNQAPWLRGPFQRVLLDPPRTGAREVLPLLGRLAPARIVYVSCNPATLARDLDDLVHRFGYRLCGAGVVDMFPHTAHVESIACLSHGH